jgi:uncharacterized membrane-anchored protein
MKTLKIILFFVVTIAMLAVPLYMILRAENIITKGNKYTFKAVPIDPYDVFRGRYVTINVEPRFVEQANSDFKSNERIYAVLGKNKEGFATFVRLQRHKPSEGDYILVQYQWRSGNKNYIQVPFTRYYMNEKLAPEAERMVRNSLDRKSKEQCTVKVRVFDGRAVIENVYIGEMPLREYVLKHSKKK